jgi:hypothetical protein
MAGPTPQEGRQKEFFTHSADIVGYGGSAGSGKSWVLRNHCWYILEFESQRVMRGEIKQSQAWVVYFRRVMPNLRQTVEYSQSEFLSIDPQAKWNANDHIWRFSNGVHFMFAAMEKKTDWTKFQSWEFIEQNWDELTEFEEEQFDHLDTRMRTTDPALKRFMNVRWGSNPTGPGLVWVRRRFVEPYKKKNIPVGTTLRVRTKLDDGKIIDKDQVFIQAYLSDNQILDADGQYRASLMLHKPQIAIPLLKGDWYYNSGGFFAPYWKQEYHECENHKIPPNVFRFRSQDWGLNDPCSTTWWYVDQWGCMTAYYNLYVKNMTVEKVAGAIQEVERYFGDWDVENKRSMLRRSPLDRKCWDRSPVAGPSIAHEYHRLGVPWIESIKDRFNGLAEICRRLDQFVDTETGLRHTGQQPLPPTARPMIRWMRRCTKPLETLPVIPGKPNNPGDTDPDAEDHAVDDTMYACGSNPMKLQKIVNEDKLEDDEREQDYKRKYLARSGLANIIKDNHNGRRRYGRY